MPPFCDPGYKDKPSHLMILRELRNHNESRGFDLLSLYGDDIGRVAHGDEDHANFIERIFMSCVTIPIMITSIMCYTQQ